MTAYATLSTRPNYAAWQISADRYRELADLLHWAVLAPSSHNTQPWAFTVEGNSIEITPDEARALAASDPSGRQLYLSLGAAVANLKIAGRRFGWRVTEQLVEDCEHNRVSKRLLFEPGEAPSEDDVRLFEAVAARAMQRGAHQPRALPNEFRVALARSAGDGVQVTLVEDAERKVEIGRLLHDADLKILADVGFTTELASWVRPNATTAYDGMPGFTLGIPDAVSRVLPAIARSGKMGPMASEQDRALLAEQTAAVTVIAARDDDPPTWLRVGELFQMLALRATELGLGIHVYAALVETEPFTTQLKQLLGTDPRPLFMFRVGYPVEPIGHAPRRPAASVRTVRVGGPPCLLPEERPTFFGLDRESFGLAELVAELGEVAVVDRYREDWLTELFSIRNPDRDFRTPAGLEALDEYARANDGPERGIWAYFPWKRTLVHLPERDDFLELLYSRNFPVIDRATQAGLAKLEVGIAGLSVGSNIARALAMCGVQRLRVADFDVLAPSNNNRIGAGSVLDVGQAKIAVLAQQLYEFNPYLELRQYPQGMHAANLAEFMDGLDVFVDHLDDLPLKVSARECARRRGVFVLMATDVAFTPMFDVEQPVDGAFFNGRLSGDGLAALRRRPEQLADWVRLAVEICGGPGNLPSQVLENFVMVSRGEQNFASQLGLTGYAAAAQLAYYVYEIARGNGPRLERHKRLHLEQSDLLDAEQHRRAAAAFAKEFP